MGLPAQPFMMKVADRIPSLARQLTDDSGAPLSPDLSAASSVMFALRPSGIATALIATTAAITNASLCVCEYAWGPGQTTPTGLLGASAPRNYYEAEFKVLYPASKMLTVPNQGYIPVVLLADIG